MCSLWLYTVKGMLKSPGAAWHVSPHACICPGSVIADMVDILLIPDLPERLTLLQRASKIEGSIGKV